MKRGRSRSRDMQKERKTEWINPESECKETEVGGGEMTRSKHLFSV